MAKLDKRKQINDFILKEIERINKEGLSQRALNEIGQGVVKEMKDMISKGISPIEGRGRFPEYKGKTNQRAEKARSGRGKKNTSRRVKPSKKGYPYDVQKKFPNKKPRPVNLFLSGDFLKNLKHFLSIGGSQRNVLEIGFTDELSVKKEDGHRTGANKQAKRPIIPQGNERFAQRIERTIQKILNQSLEKYLKVRRR